MPTLIITVLQNTADRIAAVLLDATTPGETPIMLKQYVIAERDKAIKETMAMKYIILLFVFVLVSGCAHQDEWTELDTVMLVGVSVVMVADAVTTRRIQYRPDLYEVGSTTRKVLGTQPSTSDTYLFFGSLIITNYFITRALPAKWRPYWQGYEIIRYGSAVRLNCQIDLC